MGKASRWFRAILGLKKQDSSQSPAKEKEKRKWSFVKSHREKQTQTTHVKSLPSDVVDAVDDPEKHAISVAKATAAVAEATVAAAQAAAVVVRLTSSGRCPNPAAVTRSLAAREEWAAVKIQSAFRGYLARRALRALKGLVRLQALARGHLVRKQTAEWMRQMQALLRAQARAKGVRAQVSESPNSSAKSSHLSHPGPATPEKFEHTMRVRSAISDQPYVLKRSTSRPNNRSIDDQDKLRSGWNLPDHKSYGRSFDYQVSPLKSGATVDGKDDKIVEVDSGKTVSKRRNIFYSPQVFDSVHSSQTSLKGSTQSLHPVTFPNYADDSPFCTAENSPQFLSASSRGGSSRRSPFTPTKSEGASSYFSGYSDCPSYMSYTESSRAKVRSLSAPKQRPHYERSGSAKRNSIYGFASTQRASSLRANFASKAYPGSGRLDSLGLAAKNDGMGYRY